MTQTATPVPSSMTFPRYLFMATCCSASAFLAALLQNGEGDFDRAISPTSPLFLIPFLVLLIIARLLRRRGKWSESWAFLTYGSWLTVLGTVFFLIPSSPRMNTGAWIIYTFFLVLFVGCATVGVRAALRNRWSEMGGWWLGTVPLVFLIFLFLAGLTMD